MHFPVPFIKESYVGGKMGCVSKKVSLRKRKYKMRGVANDKGKGSQGNRNRQVLGWRRSGRGSWDSKKREFGVELTG